MRCAICNSELSPNEIKWSHAHEEWEPCNTCLTIIDEVFEDWIEPSEEVENPIEEIDDVENSS